MFNTFKHFLGFFLSPFFLAPLGLSIGLGFIYAALHHNLNTIEDYLSLYAGSTYILLAVKMNDDRK